jgi:putative FmdB family regulatory protein
VCGHRFELIQRFADPPADRCASCGKGPVYKLLSAPAIHFKGTGWYVTDYGNKKSDGSPKTDSGAPTSDGSPKSDGSSKTDGSSKSDGASKTDGATKLDSTSSGGTPPAGAASGAGADTKPASGGDSRPAQERGKS